MIDPIYGQLGSNNPFAFTNSSLWMLILLAVITGFMLMGMRRELIPNRWQVAAEGLVGFVNNALDQQYFFNVNNSRGNQGNAQAVQSNLPRDFRRYGGVRAAINF